MLERDVLNLRSYFSAFAPGLKDSQYGKEIWRHYESGLLTPELALTGQVALDDHLADVDAVLLQVEMAIKEDEIRRMCRDD
jgi:RIO kinase 1